MHADDLVAAGTNFEVEQVWSQLKEFMVLKVRGYFNEHEWTRFLGYRYRKLENGFEVREDEN